MIDIIKDTIFDAIRLLPFLFLAYLLMEYLEHKTGNKTKEWIKKSGKFGPILGGALGIFPQCGFSVAAANLYAGRVITMGTLVAIFLSTSDEMLPILISRAAPISLIFGILIVKLIIGIIAGIAVDVFNLRFAKKHEKTEDTEEVIGHICEKEHCHCEHGIFKSALKHTVNISIFIIIITFAINLLIYFIGEEKIANIISNVPVIGVLISAFFGFIPNCAGSVIITELYLSNLISFGAMIAGLLVGSGIGILILFRTNKHLKENLKITSILFGIGVFSGIIIDMIL